MSPENAHGQQLLQAIAKQQEATRVAANLDQQRDVLKTLNESVSVTLLGPTLVAVKDSQPTRKELTIEFAKSSIQVPDLDPRNLQKHTVHCQSPGSYGPNVAFMEAQRTKEQAFAAEYVLRLIGITQQRVRELENRLILLMK